MATPMPTATISKYDTITVVNSPTIVVIAQPTSANGSDAINTTTRTQTMTNDVITASSIKSFIKSYRS